MKNWCLSCQFKSKPFKSWLNSSSRSPLNPVRSCHVESRPVLKKWCVSCLVLFVAHLIRFHHVPSQLVLSCREKFMLVVSCPIASHHIKFGLILSGFSLSVPVMGFHILSHGCKSRLGLLVARRGLSVHVKTHQIGLSLGLKNSCSSCAVESMQGISYHVQSDLVAWGLIRSQKNVACLVWSLDGTANPISSCPSKSGREKFMLVMCCPGSARLAIAYLMQSGHVLSDLVRSWCTLSGHF